MRTPVIPEIEQPSALERAGDVLGNVLDVLGWVAFVVICLGCYCVLTWPVR